MFTPNSSQLTGGPADPVGFSPAEGTGSAAECSDSLFSSAGTPGSSSGDGRPNRKRCSRSCSSARRPRWWSVEWCPWGSEWPREFSHSRSGGRKRFRTACLRSVVLREERFWTPWIWKRMLLFFKHLESLQPCRRLASTILGYLKVQYLYWRKIWKTDV